MYAEAISINTETNMLSARLDLSKKQFDLFVKEFNRSGLYELDVFHRGASISGTFLCTGYDEISPAPEYKRIEGDFTPTGFFSAETKAMFEAEVCYTPYPIYDQDIMYREDAIQRIRDIQKGHAIDHLLDEKGNTGPYIYAIRELKAIFDIEDDEI